MIRTPINNGVQQSDLDAAGYRISGLLAPSAGTDAATKAYVDAHAGGGGSGLPAGWVSVMDYGAVADGVTDATAAVVAAVAAATSVVYFPPGKYFFAGSIGELPIGISLVGAKEFGPHWSAYYSGSSSTDPLLGGGSILLLTANAGNATGPKFISATTDSAIVGLTFYWPNQVRTNTTPIAYPWAIYLHQGNASSVRYCEFVNAYQCIYLEGTAVGGGGGTNDNLIEEIRGEALYRGIKMEGNTSVTRLRGCYFDDQWSRGTPITAYRAANAIAFDCGRNDLTILESCFSVYYGTWLHCYNDPSHGNLGPWLQVIGGGGDLCGNACVWIEETQDHGVDLDEVMLSITSGNFAIKIDSTHTGMVRLHNSMVFNSNGNFASVAGSGQVTAEDTYFFANIGGGVTPLSLPAVTGWAVSGTGNFAMRGCTFRTSQPHVVLGASLTRAVVTGNMCSDIFNVTNNMPAGSAVIADNTGMTVFYIGPDLRITSITGGGKIEARNPGTNTWAAVDQWTNP